MKKILLIAAAALITVSANAQKVNKGFTKRSQSKDVVVSKGQHTIVKETDATLKLVNKNFMKKNSNVAMMKYSLKPANTINKNSIIRKAGAVQSTYNGSGKDYFSGDKLTWTMTSGSVPATDTDPETLFLEDVIPLPEDWASLESIPVVYTLEGSTITIEPQKVVSGTKDDGSSVYYYIHSWASDDGAIVFTVGDDGSITTIEGEDIAYSAFSEDRFSLSSADGIYISSVEDVVNLQYRLPGQVIIPNAEYVPSSFFLKAGINTSWNYWYLMITSPTAAAEFTNKTDNFDQNAWTVNYAEWTGSEWTKGEVAAEGQDTDFSFVPEREGVYYVPELIASYEGNAGEPAYYLDPDVRFYAGSYAGSFNFGDGTSLPTWGNFDLNGGLALANTAGADAIVTYQGKPGSPLYFEGINVLMYNFSQKENFNMTCKIVKATRDDATGDIVIGETIAESEVDLDAIEEGSQCTRLNFNDFYAYDEDGMSYGLDYIMIEDEFAVVFEGVNTSASDATYAGSFLCLTDNGMYAYAILAGETDWRGYGWSGKKVAVGFNEAVLGYLYTEDNTDITLPEEGGSQSIHIEPMLAGQDGTMLDIDQNSELPEWISLDIENEVYTDDEYSFDLVVTADPLTSASGAPRKEAAAGRTATFTVFQPGAKLDITVTQGTVTGISDVKVTKTATDGKVYNVAGQRLNSNAKGLIIKDGKKFIVK